MATKVSTKELKSLFKTPKSSKTSIKKKKPAELIKVKKSPKIKSSTPIIEILRSKKAPTSIVKKTGGAAEEEIAKWLSTEVGFLEGLTEDVLGNPTSLYGYQIVYINDRSYFIHIDKARQTGYSYIYACRSLAKSHLQPHHTSIFISINQEEANEKIVYAQGLYESLPLSVKKKRVVDNKHSLEFEDPSGLKKTRTRIISHAQREPRGKGGNVDVYLDEAAHYTWGDEIYVAAIPIITRGSGTMTIGSSPLGKTGIHYEITANASYRKIYSYHQVYWWHCIDFVKHGFFKKAQKIAPGMSTEERVATFGSEKIIGIFISLDLEQFQQEYELLHIDESVSFFPIDLINKCVYEVVLDNVFFEDDEFTEKARAFPIVEKYPNVDFKFYQTIEDLAVAVQSGKVSEKLYGGYDVGRHHHSGEFSIIEELNTDPPLQIIRHLQEFRNKKFKVQKNYLKRCLDLFPRLKLQIDSGGLGEDMSEDLSDYSWRVEPLHFTNEWKENICSDTRIRLEDYQIAIPNIKELKNQIHSIKRKVTEAGRFIFDSEKNRAHHGDKFWAVAMASSLGTRPSKKRLIIPSTGLGVINNKIIPISRTRTFGRVPFPRQQMQIGVEGLVPPIDIATLHKLKRAMA